jgi:hypothetical protein
VPTDRQGASGWLGLDAHLAAVAGFVGSGQLVAEFTEIESGRRHMNRPQLLAAPAECFISRQCKTRLKIEPAQLMTSQLSELSKYVALYGTALMDEGKAAQLSQKIAALN